jgi:membrane-bound lytic murein transglycosylase A
VGAPSLGALGGRPFSPWCSPPPSPQAPTTAAPDRVGDARLEPATFADLPGWPDDDHGAALLAFRRTCAALASGRPSPRPAVAPDADLLAACRAAAAPEAAADPRAFFERAFQPHRVLPPGGDGFLTGYFEPEVEGSLERTDAFPVPLLARPDDLVTVAPGEGPPGLDPALAAARRTPDGFEPYPDRAAIEDGALGARARPIVHLRDPVDAFMIHVQGSARIRLSDGSVLRVAFDGRNGHPYTAVGRWLVQSGVLPLSEAIGDRLWAWLRAHPDEGRAAMRKNRSFIFFRVAGELDPREGPIGGAGVPLTPGRSLAVDRSLWRYGLPVWLDGTFPAPGGEPEPLRRLTVAADTGTAIVGPARGDLFVGSGPEAGRRAGLLRHPVRFTVLLPRPAPAAP